MTERDWGVGVSGIEVVPISLLPLPGKGSELPSNVTKEREEEESRLRDRLLINKCKHMEVLVPAISADCLFGLGPLLFPCSLIPKVSI